MTHQPFYDLAAAYALGSLDPEARTEFELHLQGSAGCRSEVDSHRGVVGLLAFASPAVPLANVSALRERILREAAAVRPISSAAVRRNSLSRITWAAAAASLVLATLSGLAWRQERERASRLGGELAQARSEIATRDSTLAAFLGPEVHVVSLSEADRKPSARIFWNHTRNTFIVTAFNVPPAPEGKTYQLWALRKGKPPLSMGTFNTDASGRATAIVAVGPEINEGGFIDDCALTLEPAGGSAFPSETPRLMGAWRHVD